MQFHVLVLVIFILNNLQLHFILEISYLIYTIFFIFLLRKKIIKKKICKHPVMLSFSFLLISRKARICCTLSHCRRQRFEDIRRTTIVLCHQLKLPGHSSIADLGRVLLFTIIYNYILFLKLAT